MEVHVKRMLSTQKMQTAVRKYKLTQLEAESLVWYTADFRVLHPGENAKFNVFYQYNAALRKRSHDQIRRWWDFSWFLVCALRKLPPVKKKVFRGVPERVLTLSSSYVKDRHVVWISFTSTTLDRDGTMKSFGEGGTFVHIEAIDARDISELSLLPQEKELLLMPNARFRVQNVLNAEDAAKFTQAFGGQLPADVDMILLKQVETESEVKQDSTPFDSLFVRASSGVRAHLRLDIRSPA
eukprot:3935532-Rhodomonas_salina.1